MSSIPISWIIF